MPDDKTTKAPETAAPDTGPGKPPEQPKPQESPKEAPRHGALLYQQKKSELYRRCHRQPAVFPVPGAGKAYEGAGREEALKRGCDRRYYAGGQEGGRQSDFDER